MTAHRDNRSQKPNCTSIIIPCWNQLEYTRICLESVFRNSGEAYELTIVDNGSTDGTAAYLAGICDTSTVPVTVISNKQNKGFPAAINQGLQAAKGEYLVLLNNDTVVTDGWLDRLIAVSQEKAERRRSIGLVGPVSNYVSPPQLIEAVPYQTLDDLSDFARQWRKQHHGKWFPATKLSGFCLLMTRAIYKSIGGLDERFGLGMFEDDDLALRARKAGFELAVAQDVFIHHFGSRTFAGQSINANVLLKENKARFQEKWGAEAPPMARVSPQSLAGNPRSDASKDGDKKLDEKRLDRTALSPRKVKVSLTMIVRNEEKNLPHCLESVQGIFDEIVVVDTGSTDRTKEIARGIGARLVEFTWTDDFAAARNVALDHATGDYALWLDADDVIEPAEKEKLKRLFSTLRQDKKEAYVLKCFSATDAGGMIAVDQPRLFPVLPGIRWERRIHEVINPALERAGVSMTWTDIVIRHTGYADETEYERKRQRNLLLLQKELAERPDDPFIYYYLGTLAFERKRWQEALGYFILSLAKWGTTQSVACKLYAMIAWTNQILQRYDESLRVADEGLTSFPNNGELWFRKSIALRYLRRSTEAEACFTRILSLGHPKTLYNVDPGIYGYMTRGNLAIIAEERGDYAIARAHWQAALAEYPGYPEALRRLAQMDT